MPKFKIRPRIIESADAEVEWKQEEDTPPPSDEEYVEEPEPTEEEVKKEKRKKKLSEAQLAALAKGRAKVAENQLFGEGKEHIKRRKELMNKKSELVKKKKDKEFVEKGITQNKVAKQKKSELRKSTKEDKMREKLLNKKKRAEWEIQRKADWELMREDTLDKCENIEDFDELCDHLDTIDEEDIFDDEKLKSKLNNIYDKYKYVPKETAEFRASEAAEI